MEIGRAFAIAVILAQAAQPTAPPGTDIWLARLAPSGEIEQPINITARPGYDNQPSFTPDSKGLLFTSRREGDQTDIYLYDFTSRTSAPTRVTNTPESEYSPTVTPDGNGITVIRVEAGPSTPATTPLGAGGVQRLWRFARDGSSPAIVLANVKPVGYHAWAPDGLLALFVLGNPNTLQVADSRTGKSVIVTERVGRSMHRIPGRDTVSILHTDPKDGKWIKELNLRTRALTPIVRPLETQDGDYAWTPDGAILMSDGKTLRRWKAGSDWTTVADLAAAGLSGVTRMAVSPDGKWLAMVAPDSK